MSIIDLIKNKKIKLLIKKIEDEDDINLNVKDTNYNYFIYYVLLYNEEKVLDIILNKNIRLDILDTDGRNILYIPIKFGYINMLKKILEIDLNNIGIPIIDNKDKIGLTPLHYSIIFNNIEAFNLLIKNNSNLLIKNNQNLNAFHIAIQYNRIDFFIILISQVNELSFVTPNNENLLQYCIIYDYYNFIPLILKKKINVNNQEISNGLTALHQLVIKNNINLVQELINYGANINIQDYYGNTILHYLALENYVNIIMLIFKYNPNYNSTNIDGNTPLHIYLENNFNNKNILDKLILETDLNIQNNSGITCLKYIVDLNIFDDHKDILKNKELNFFIKDNNNKDLYDNLSYDNILSTAIDSYYNIIKKKKDSLLIDWEIWCSNDIIDKLKSLNTKHSEPIKICKEKIKEIILKEKRTLPKISTNDLILDNGIFVNMCYYTGIPLDILFGIVYLKKHFASNGLDLILDYPLTVNKSLENYYQKLGIDYPFKLEFSNCEILWSFQKIFFPSYFDDELEKKIKDVNVKFITIPLGIEITNFSHANILLIDKINNTVERFEPNGSNQPIGLNYNQDLLDDILKNKFSLYDLKYLKPKDFLPAIGFQVLENIEESKCKRLGDPNGFCGVWCIWWVFHRIKNKNILNTDLSLKLITNIKLENKSFRTLIRNFSYYITELRDDTLKSFNIDINDWIVNSIDDVVINNLEKKIFKLIR